MQRRPTRPESLKLLTHSVPNHPLLGGSGPPASLGTLWSLFTARQNSTDGDPKSCEKRLASSPHNINPCFVLFRSSFSLLLPQFPHLSGGSDSHYLRGDTNDIIVRTL